MTAVRSSGCESLTAGYNCTVPPIESAALAWTVLAVVAAVVEISVPHFGLIFVSVAAVAAALVSVAGPGFLGQMGVFVVVLALSVGLLRPRMVARLGSRGIPSRTETLIGRDGIVTADIEATVGAGRVNVGGEDWAARSAAPISAGTRIRVVSADGIVLEVIPA